MQRKLLLDALSLTIRNTSVRNGRLFSIASFQRLIYSKEQLMHNELNNRGFFTFQHVYTSPTFSSMVKNSHSNNYGTSSIDNKEEKDNEKPLSQRQKLSKVFAQYGTAAVVFHTGLSLTSLGTCYVFVSSGIDMVGLLEKFSILSGDTMQASIAGGASTFVVAYAVHKVFMPIRIFLTVTCTPLLVRKLRDIGIMKGEKTDTQSGKP